MGKHSRNEWIQWPMYRQNGGEIVHICWHFAWQSPKFKISNQTEMCLTSIWAVYLIVGTFQSIQNCIKSTMTKFISYVDTDKIPEGAKTISAEHVEAFYAKLVERWKPQSEIWALAFGANVLGVLAAASGFHINWYFRRRLLLKNHGFFSTYLPNTVIPMVVVSALQPTVSLSTNLLNESFLRVS